jgi:transposase
MISAISTQGEIRFMLQEGTVGAKEFVEFLERLMVNADKPVFLIVDGHPAHKAKLVKNHVESLSGKLKLFYLPPYSPHLNPDETVWAHVKRKVSTRLVGSAEEMKRFALGALRSIQKLPALVKSFFRHPDCRYILDDVTC